MWTQCSDSQSALSLSYGSFIWQNIVLIINLYNLLYNVSAVINDDSLLLQALLQMVQSHDGSIRSVVEKGDALLTMVRYPSVRDKMNRLQRDYTDLCGAAMVRMSKRICLEVGSCYGFSSTF